ncbi:MAG TPA: hypothetical protein VNA29_02665 [Sphingomicrobium sp.]|nr:hypothetical protein [Sphingomicrobium sp.]
MMRIAYALLGLAVLAGGPVAAQGLERLIIPQPAMDRTAQILRAFNAGNLASGETATLSIQSPSGAGSSRLELEHFRHVKPAENSAESYPEPQRSLIRVKWSAEPALRYVIDCDLRMIGTNPEPTGFFSNSSADNQSVDIIKGRAGFLTNPGASWITLSANGPFAFRSCSVTSVG